MTGLAHLRERSHVIPARVVLIGLGAVARDIHLPALCRHPRAELVAAADPDPEARALLARRARRARLYESADAMLATEQPDVAIIATPPHTHSDLCLMSLGYGAHVLCEKPFVSDLDQADQVMAAAEAARRVVAVNHQYRYLPLYAEPLRQLHQGIFGRLYYVEARQQMLVSPGQESGWRGELRHRVLFEFGMHVLDLLTCFFGSEPLAVSARTPRVLPGSQTDALVVLRLDYPDERVATVVLNRASQAATQYLDVRLECEQASVRMAFGGIAEARLGWSPERNRPQFRVSLARGGEAWAEAQGHAWRLVRLAREGRPHATAALLDQLLDAAVSGKEVAVSARYARELLRIVAAAYSSAEQGGELVRLDRSRSNHSPASAAHAATEAEGERTDSGFDE